MREVKIMKAMNGYIVRVGCQTLVFMSLEYMLSEIQRYCTDPYGVEKEYQQQYGFTAENAPSTDAYQRMPANPVQEAPCLR